MRKGGDSDLLLLLLFPGQMVLQMKWIKIGSSSWLVTGADWPLQWDLTRRAAHRGLGSLPRASCGDSENRQVNNWPLTWCLLEDALLLIL